MNFVLTRVSEFARDKVNFHNIGVSGKVHLVLHVTFNRGCDGTPGTLDIAVRSVFIEIHKHSTLYAIAVRSRISNFACICEEAGV